ncbi:MAG: enoyl-CoA hydratase/isomerase family protein [Acidobacteria bacterium]|nr:enoyl-CoA hydratase/isomerase family protein [Acidobacteriota bacterium]
MSGAGTVLVEDRGAVRVLSLSRGRANALAPDLIQDLLSALVAAREDAAVRALVLTSASPKIFSAGLDLALLAAAEADVFTRFVDGLEEVLLTAFELPKPFVGALTGHAIAGGALLAAPCDLRVAAEGPGTFGLPEVTLGVKVPRTALHVARATWGERAASRLALTGVSVPFAEAQALGAIDAIVSPDLLLDEAVSRAAALGALPPGAFAAIKRDLRGDTSTRLRAESSANRAAFVASWTSEEGRAGLAAALSKLKG